MRISLYEPWPGLLLRWIQSCIRIWYHRIRVRLYPKRSTNAGRIEPVNLALRWKGKPDLVLLQYLS